MSQKGEYPDIFQVDITKDTMERASSYTSINYCALSTAVRDLGFKDSIYAGPAVLYINNVKYKMTLDNENKVYRAYSGKIPVTITLKKVKL